MVVKQQDLPVSQIYLQDGMTAHQPYTSISM